jgi:ferredoxin
VGGATVLHAQEEKVASGLALVEDKAVPERKTPLKPAGAISLKNFESRCTACQLCVSKCPEHVLRPSTSLDGFMQPTMVFDQGFCRVACTRCSELCPSGAIQRIGKEEKTAISIGYAVVLKDNCIGCGLCARHCPASAIQMVDGIPAVNENKCIGCGKCEYYCPSTPTKAIFVEGREAHVTI